MADSDDDMPPLEYAGVGVPPAAATQATPPEDDDDDMPPLEYVGADASLGISLREGDSVILKGLSKTALNGQTGTLQSFQKASKGRLPVKLDKSGSMLAVKPENIEKINTKVGGIPNHGVASAKATHVDRNASPPPPDDDDDELPPLEYVGEITNGTAEHGTGQMSDADDMPSLEYFGTSKPSGPNHSKDSQPSVSKPSPPYAEARATGAPKEVPAATEKVLLETPVSTFRPGDQVLIKGTTKQLDGQQGIIESIKDGTCFVRLEKNKDVLQLGEANLHKIWLRGSGAGAMPPLQMVGQAGSAPLYSAPNGQNGTTEVERIKAPAESKAPRSSQGNRQETQDALQKMRSALHATASHEVDDALRLAETPGMAWGEWETEKTQILKQLRTKRSQIVEVRPQESQEVSRTVKKSTIETWCEELQLPQKLLARLNEEDVTDPEELTGVGETELAALTSGLKIGPKGRFMKAVKRMKALEAAELGSAVSLS